MSGGFNSFSITSLLLWQGCTTLEILEKTDNTIYIKIYSFYSPELNPAVAGTHLPIGPTAYLNLVTRPAHIYIPMKWSFECSPLVWMLACMHSVNSCTCCVVFMVVYDVRYGVEGVFLSQEELPGVTYFDLVMPDVPASTADKPKERKIYMWIFIMCEFVVCLSQLWREAPWCFGVDRDGVNSFLTGLSHHETSLFVLETTRNTFTKSFHFKIWIIMN